MRSQERIGRGDELSRRKNVVEVEVEEHRDVALVCSECKEDLEIAEVQEGWSLRDYTYVVFVKPHICEKEDER